MLWRNGFDANRIQTVKHRVDVIDPSALEHPGDPLYKALFLGPRSRRQKLAEWYARLLRSSNLENFCEVFIRDIIVYFIAEP